MDFILTRNNGLNDNKVLFTTINGVQYLMKYYVRQAGEIEDILPPVLPMEGEVTAQLGTAGTTMSGEFVGLQHTGTTLSGIYVLPDESRFYIKHSYVSDFHIFDNKGNFMKTSEKLPGGVTSYIDYSQTSKLCVSKNHTFLLSAYSRDILMKHDLNGNYINHTTIPNVSSIDGFSEHSNGNIYIGDRYVNKITVIDSSLNVVNQFSVDSAWCNNTAGIAVTDTHMYIADYGANCIFKTDLNGQNVEIIASYHDVHTPACLSPIFEGIKDVQLSPLKDKLYFVTYTTHSLGVFDLATNTVENSIQDSTLSGMAICVNPWGTAAYIVAVARTGVYIYRTTTTVV